MECRCEHVDVFWGDEAIAYASEHLASDAQGSLVCPDTGAQWEALRTPEGQDELRKVATYGRDLPPPAAA